MTGGLLLSLTALAFPFASPIQADTAGTTLKIAICHGPGKGPLGDYRKYLESRFRIKCFVIEADKSRDQKATPFNNIDALDKCDVILSNLYRTWAPAKQLEKLKKHFLSKPVVGLRKAHHGFQNWLAADKEVFGVRYRGHYFLNKKKQIVRIVPGREKHALIAGHKPSMPGGGLYRHEEAAKDVTVLLEGGPSVTQMQPQTWFRIRDKQRVFYTRYDPKDLARTDVRELVTRALLWAANADAKLLRK